MSSAQPVRLYVHHRYQIQIPDHRFAYFSAGPRGQYQHSQLSCCVARKKSISQELTCCVTFTNSTPFAMRYFVKQTSYCVDHPWIRIDRTQAKKGRRRYTRAASSGHKGAKGELHADRVKAVRPAWSTRPPRMVDTVIFSTHIPTIPATMDNHCPILKFLHGSLSEEDTVAWSQ